MTRIASLPVDKWDRELRELAQADTLPPVQQTMLGVYANAPELAKPFLKFSGAMSQAFTLRRRLLELVRLRITQRDWSSALEGARRPGHDRSQLSPGAPVFSAPMPENPMQ
jgi:hypothetical protein